MISTEKTFLITIRLATENMSLQHRKESELAMSAILGRQSTRECRLLFTSPCESTYGWLLYTAQTLEKLESVLNGATEDMQISSLLSMDSFVSVAIWQEHQYPWLRSIWSWLRRDLQRKTLNSGNACNSPVSGCPDSSIADEVRGDRVNQN